MNEPERRSESNLSQKNTARQSPKPAKKKIMIEDQVIEEETYQEISNRK
jgi:hypothetical protein